MGEVFVSERPIAFGDVDYARILYYPRFFHYCHQAMEDFVGQVVGVDYATFLGERKLGFPTVRVECDYRVPLPYGAVLRMEMSVVKLGEKSVVMRYRARNAGQEPICAEATITHVLVDMDRFEGLVIPEWIREAVIPFLED